MHQIPLRILIVDDHVIVRQGLRELLEKQADMEIAAEASEGRTAIEMAREVAPDVIVMDINMPDVNGIEATRQIVANSPGIKVIALSMHSDKYLVTQILSAGASGYLRKDCAVEELIGAIRTVVGGGTYLTPAAVDIVVKDHFHKQGDSGFSGLASLTNREREVLKLLVDGRTAKEIAGQLYVSTRTVDTHRQQIMKKLNVHSVVELTKLAIREGLTSVDT